MKYTELRSGTSVRWFRMQISIWLELGFRSQFRYEIVSRIIADSRPCNSSNPETFIEVLVMWGLSSCSTLCSFRRWFESANFRFRILKQSELRVFSPYEIMEGIVFSMLRYWFCILSPIHEVAHQRVVTMFWYLETSYWALKVSDRCLCLNNLKDLLFLSSHLKD